MKDKSSFELLEAVFSGNLKKAKNALKKNKSDVNMNYEDGRSPLQIASFNGGLEIVKLLVENGADIEAFNQQYKCQAIHFAVNNGHHKVVEFLIDHCKADIVNAVDDNFRSTPILFASQSGDVEMVRLLAKKGANVNVMDNNGSTPIQFAAQIGSFEIAKILLDNEAELVGRSIRAIFLAAQLGHTEIVRLLVARGANVNAMNDGNVMGIHHSKNKSNDSKVTSLYLAIQNGKIDTAKALIELGARGDVSLERDQTSVLHLAAEEGHTELVEPLLKNGANVNAKDKHGMTPLFYAIQKGKTETAKTLIELGAGVDLSRDIYQTTLLHLAAYLGNTQMTKLLVEKGVNIDVIDTKDKKTPLYLAIENNKTEAAKTLIELGANVNLADEQKNTPLHLAIKQGHTELVEPLLKSGADSKATDRLDITPLFIAVQEGHTQIVRLLLEKGAEIDKIDKLGRTALHIAIENNKTETALALIELGANVNLPDGTFNFTPLQIAAQKGNTRLLKPLIDKGADVNEKDEKGNTPYLLASKNGNSETAKALIKLGAKDLKDLTPLEIIAIDGRAEALRSIIDQERNNQSNPPSTPNPRDSYKSEKLDKNTKAPKR